MIERKKAGRPSLKPSEEELAMLYKAMTMREVAQHYGVTEQTVKRWIYGYRREARERGEDNA